MNKTSKLKYFVMCEKTKAQQTKWLARERMISFSFDQWNLEKVQSAFFSGECHYTMSYISSLVYLDFVF